MMLVNAGTSDHPDLIMVRRRICPVSGDLIEGAQLHDKALLSAEGLVLSAAQIEVARQLRQDHVSGTAHAAIPPPTETIR